MKVKPSFRLILFTFILVIVLPYAYWTSQNDFKNLKLRSRETIGKVVEVKRDKIVFEYSINGTTLVKVKDLPKSDYKISRGDKLILIYDSIDFENVQIIWDE